MRTMTTRGTWQAGAVAWFVEFGWGESPRLLISGDTRLLYTVLDMEGAGDASES